MSRAAGHPIDFLPPHTERIETKDPWLGLADMNESCSLEQEVEKSPALDPAPKVPGLLLPAVLYPGSRVEFAVGI